MDEVKKIALETLQSISPIVVMVIVLQLIFFDDPLSQVLQFAIGAVMVTVGLWLFLVGVQVGLLRIGEIIGSELPQRASFPVILLFVFIIGIAIIMAEPNIMVLSEQIGYVAGDAISKIVLITFVGVGLGLFLVIAVLQLAVVYVPFLQPVFHTVPLYGEHWVVVLGISSAPIILGTIFKYLKDRTRKILYLKV
jgi:magnesium-transporting ATPase (P-type)